MQIEDQIIDGIKIQRRMSKDYTIATIFKLYSNNNFEKHLLIQIMVSLSMERQLIS